MISLNKLRPKMIRYLTVITLLMMAAILAGMFVLDVHSVQITNRENAEQLFGQIRQILAQNEADLAEIQKQYSSLCLANARTIAYILEKEPEMLENRDLEGLCKVAGFVQVDEIHIFDPQGVIIFGTQPQYYGLSMDSGEQIGFFRPMLEDHSLTMIQDITPNSATGTPVQYSALWSENGEFIVQIGMYPNSVLKARSKNEISYIFSLLRVNTGIDLYATEIKSGMILGCTNSQYTGKLQTEIGLPDVNSIVLDQGFVTDISGERCYAVFTRENDKLLGYVIPFRTMLKNSVRTWTFFGLGLLLISFIVVLSVVKLIGSFVIDDIYRVNDKLRKITDGHLEESVDVQSSQEFSELSRHINDMVDSLVESRRQIEKDRDMDLLTDMYNRRGLDNELLKLQKSGEDLGHFALLMIDADCLKTINDLHGHENGDIYLCRIADLLKKAGVRKSLCARQGGDEFVVFLYGYETEELLTAAIDNLRMLQSGQMAELQSGVVVELQFSVGWSLAEGNPDYHAMIKEADAAMYANKRERHCRIR